MHKSKDEAMELGYTYANPKRKWYLEEVAKISCRKPVAIHCWRGGMRSRLFAEHLHQNGFSDVSVIIGGYKSWRRLLDKYWKSQNNLLILGGYTGSGKTHVLRHLEFKGQQIIDLEKFACHKGSAFGSIGQSIQPTTEQFENNLYDKMRFFDANIPVWLEDESRNIGHVQLPANLFAQMRNSITFFLDIPREIRAKHLVNDYVDASFDELKTAILKISRRLGGQNLNLAIRNLEEGNLYEVAYIALSYYDKAYRRGLEFHNNDKVIVVKSDTVDPEINVNLILEKYEQRKCDSSNTI